MSRLSELDAEIVAMGKVAEKTLKEMVELEAFLLSPGTAYKRQDVRPPLKPPAKRATSVRPSHKLTDQEQEIAEMYLADVPIQDIADKISRESKTVLNKLWHIRKKQPGLLPHRIKPKQKSG